MKRSKFFKRVPAGDERGFTLLDALFAVFIFAYGILATVSMQNSSLNANMLAEQTTEASSAAASVIEDLNRMDYVKDAELTNGTHALPNMDQYGITYDVQEATIIDNTKLIQTTINWTVNGRPRSVNLVLIKPDII